MKTLTLTDERLALATDLYQMTMYAAYVQQGRHDTATFELFVRQLPRSRGFLIAAGLEQALGYLRTLHFSESDIGYLMGLPVFARVRPDVWTSLREFRFCGEVWAVPEGTAVFGGEPILRVTAPLPQAQIVETYLLSVINFQTSVASKAARVVLAARGRAVVDFGTRRAHGPQAGMWAARAAYVAGCAGTSNLAAGEALGIPVFGTMAHSYVMAHATEAEAFSAYREVFPDHATFLLDTYDVDEALKSALALRHPFQGVRLDSGDVAAQSRGIRARLDKAGLNQARIVASGDLDEYQIDALLRRRAPIDTFGVGTAMATSMDAPALGGVYKLVEIDQGDGRPRGAYKRSVGKATLPGRKQVYRMMNRSGRFVGDVIELDHPESHPPKGGQALLEKVMEGGEPILTTGLEAARARCADQLKRLPDGVKRLAGPNPYPVHLGKALEAVAHA